MAFQLRQPRRFQRQKITSKEELASHLQMALQVELSTIPPYLCSLYSMQDNTSEAFQVVKGVVIEEMLHLMLVCNMLNAIGTDPQIEEAAAVYPTFVPGHGPGGPLVSLQAATPALFETVFMAIELPAAAGARPEANNFDTIGQLYAAIADGFERLNETMPGTLFTGNRNLQQTDSYFGGSGGRLIPVTNLRTALLAIREIVDQGEGSSAGNSPYPGDQPFGTFNDYGMRRDGTVGPLVGTSWEMSHYGRFSRIATGQVALPAVWPMVPNPSTSSVTGDIQELSQLFDDVYGLLLRGLDQTVTSPNTQGTFFSVVLPLMHTALPLLAITLMQTPLYEGASSSLGPNAGPAFGVGTATADEALAACTALIEASSQSDDSLRRTTWVSNLTIVQSALQSLTTVSTAKATP